MDFVEVRQCQYESFNHLLCRFVFHTHTEEAVREDFRKS
jgi:hypothetical protein